MKIASGARSSASINSSKNNPLHFAVRKVSDEVTAGDRKRFCRRMF
jgi:hypothetical protein